MRIIPAGHAAAPPSSAEGVASGVADASGGASDVEPSGTPTAVFGGPAEADAVAELALLPASSAGDEDFEQEAWTMTIVTPATAIRASGAERAVDSTPGGVRGGRRAGGSTHPRLRWGLPHGQLHGRLGRQERARPGRGRVISLRRASSRVPSASFVLGRPRSELGRR